MDILMEGGNLSARAQRDSNSNYFFRWILLQYKYLTKYVTNMVCDIKSNTDTFRKKYY